MIDKGRKVINSKDPDHKKQFAPSRAAVLRSWHVMDNDS